MLDVLLKIASVALLVAFLAHFLRRPRNLRILARDGRVAVDGPALAPHRGQVAEFFTRHLAEVHQARVDGFWDGRRLELRCRGLSGGQQQRLRNYLLTIL